MVLRHEVWKRARDGLFQEKVKIPHLNSIFSFSVRNFFSENNTVVAACEVVHDTILIGKENLVMSRVHLAMRYTNVSSGRACDCELNNVGEIDSSRKVEERPRMTA